MATLPADLEVEFRRLRPALFRYALRMTGSASDAEDITQDVFVIAFRNLSRLQSDSQLKTWLYGIAHNRVCRLIRRRKIEVLFRPRGKGNTEFEVSLILASVVLDLPVRIRDPFVLVKIEGLTCEEAAEVVGAPVGTVKSRIHEAVTALRKSLSEPCPKVEETQHVS